MSLATTAATDSPREIWASNVKIDQKKPHQPGARLTDLEERPFLKGITTYAGITKQREKTSGRLRDDVQNLSSTLCRVFEGQQVSPRYDLGGNTVIQVLRPSEAIR